MIVIDGSAGEGGGQVLRSSLALSLCLGIPFRIHSIRRSRARPGLRPQHLAAVRAAARVGRAEVTGAGVGSGELSFVPRTICPGHYEIDIGTAGSTTLVLQAILPALLIASGPSRLTLRGGTHNPKAPPFDFIAQAYLPLINRLGPHVEAHLERHGFYPAGGGVLHVSIEPATGLQRVRLERRGRVLAVSATASVANLPEHIANRELGVLQRKLAVPPGHAKAEVLSGVAGPGNIVTVAIRSEHITELFAGFGERGIRAERVASRLAAQVNRYLAADVPVGEYLADQLPLPMALAGGGAYATGPLSAHTLTQIAVIEQFLSVEFGREEVRQGVWRISVGEPA